MFQNIRRNQGTVGFGRGRSKLKCSHCHMTGHTRETCYKHIGYPSGWKARDYTRPELGTYNVNNVVTEKNPGSQLTQEQVEQLSQMLEMFKSGAMNQPQIQMTFILYTHSIVLDNESWLVDSGASCHFSYNANLLIDITKLKHMCWVSMPNGQSLRVKYSGTCWLNKSLVLRDVLLVPEFMVNLISLNKLVLDNDCVVKFTKSACVVQDRDHKIILETGPQNDGLFSTKKGTEVRAFAVDKFVSDITVSHDRLGHAPVDTISTLLKTQIQFVKPHKLECLICPLAKQSKLSFPLSNTITIESFQLLHPDVWGPFSEETMSGCRYFLTLVDDFSRTTWTYLMKSKAETAGIVMSFFKMVFTQFGKNVKCFRSDNGGEFFFAIF